MAISLISALTLTPMMAAYMLKPNARRGKLFMKFYAPVEKGLGKLDMAYGKLLKWAVTHKLIVVLTAIVIFISSLMLIKIIPTEFFPVQDNARMSINIKFPIGTRMETCRAFADKFQQKLRNEYPEILRINFNVGQPDNNNTWAKFQDNGSHVVAMNIRLLKKTQRKRGLLEIADGIRKELKQYPEINTFAVSTGGGMMGGQSNVTVEIYGYDFDVTDKFAAEIAAKMRQIKGCTEANISRSEYAPEIQVDFDRRKLAENGLNLATASTYIQNRFSGSIASFYREDGDEYYIKVRYAPQFRQSTDAIEDITVYNAQGNGIKVRELGKVGERLTPPTIERKDRERVVKVVGVVGSGAALSQIADATKEILNQAETPAGVSTILSGTFQDQQEAFSDLFLLGLLIVILVYIVMASQFESFTYPFVIMFSILFALSGVFIGLAVTKSALGLMAALGIVMLVGIVVKNGIVLIDYTILCRERGMSINEAVVTAGRSRLRPILMTTLTTVLGMVPLAVGKGEGAEMWNSLGTTVAWGLSFSTLITLILIPILYATFAHFGAWRKRRNALKI